MHIRLVNLPLSNDTLTVVPPLNLAYWTSCVKLLVDDLQLHDLENTFARSIDFDSEIYDLTNSIFGGASFASRDPLRYNEFIFDILPAVDTLFALLYHRNESQVLEDFYFNKAARIGTVPWIVRERIEELMKLLDDFVNSAASTDILLANMPTASSIVAGMILFDKLREVNPDAKLLAAGPMVGIPVISELLLGTGSVDSLLLGDVEISLSHLFSFDDIQKTRTLIESNTVFPQDGQSLLFSSLDEVPIPDFSKLDLRRYGTTKMGLRLLPFELSRGCVFGCDFCSYRISVGANGIPHSIFRRKSLHRIERELDEISNYGKPDIISFTDLTLNSSPDWIQDIVPLLESTDLLFSGNLRADLLTEEVIEKLSHAGFIKGVLGIETLSSSSISRYRKGSSEYVSKVRNVIELLLRKNIIAQVNVLLGHPFETINDLKQSMRMFHEFSAYLKGKQLPTFDWYPGIVYINYGSKMYDQVTSNPSFSILYHEIPDYFPANNIPIKKLVSKIPYKLIRVNSPADITKQYLLDFIYNLWSDTTEVSRFQLSIMLRNAKYILTAWLRNNMQFARELPSVAIKSIAHQIGHNMSLRKLDKTLSVLSEKEHFSIMDLLSIGDAQLLLTRNEMSEDASSAFEAICILLLKGHIKINW